MNWSMQVWVRTSRTHPLDTCLYRPSGVRRRFGAQTSIERNKKEQNKNDRPSACIYFCLSAAIVNKGVYVC